MKQVKLTTSLGDIVLELDDVSAPVSVANFLKYVETNFYNGTIFHRVIKGFMVQGGGFKGGMSQPTTDKPIQNEAKNGLANDRGTIAMARTNQPHSASSQFFINLVDNKFLNWATAADGWGYAVFGKVIEGMDVIDKIAEVKTGRKGFHDDVPLEDVAVFKAEVLTPAEPAGDESAEATAP